jgi:hypothetical protein
MERTEENTTIETRGITVKNHLISWLENFGVVSSMVVLLILFMQGTCVLSVLLYQLLHEVSICTICYTFLTRKGEISPISEAQKESSAAIAKESKNFVLFVSFSL